MLGIAFIPGSALVVVALVIAGFLVHQAVRTREQAMDTAAAADRTARAVVSLQGQRAAAMATPDHRSSAYAIFTQRIDTAIAGLRDYARRAPDAESGYQQTTAIQLLSVAEGMYRADSLALAGLDDVTRRSFVLAVAAYRAELAQVSGQLTETGREAYEAVTRSADWSRLAAAEDALAAAEPLPIPESTWRGAAYTVSLQLGQLYTRQSQYAVQLTLDDGRRTLSRRARGEHRDPARRRAPAARRPAAGGAGAGAGRADHGADDPPGGSHGDPAAPPHTVTGAAGTRAVADESRVRRPATPMRRSPNVIGYSEKSTRLAHTPPCHRGADWCA